MPKRTSDTTQRATVDHPPAKRTRNCAEPDLSLANDTTTNHAVKSATESSETETTGPTTPQEWDKTDDETERGADEVAVAPVASVNAPTAAEVATPALSTATTGPAIPLVATPPTDTATPAGPVDPAVTGAPAIDNAPAVTTAQATAAPTATAATPAIATFQVGPAPHVIAAALVMPLNPTLADVQALFKNIDYVPRGDKRRMLDFARKNDNVHLRYALSQVPASAKWGSTPKTAKILCIDDKPVTIWAVGDVETTWFRDLQGNPHDRINIGFRLPFVHDDDGLRRLYSMARPARGVDDVVYAGKRMVVYRKGESLPTILPFNNCYDARKRFQAKSQMPTLESSAIGKRDIILVEGKFTRWNAATDKRAKREWKVWGVGFELEAVSLLYEAPEGVDPAPSDEVADIDDDM